MSPDPHADLPQDEPDRTEGELPEAVPDPLKTTVNEEDYAVEEEPSSASHKHLELTEYRKERVREDIHGLLDDTQMLREEQGGIISGVLGFFGFGDGESRSKADKTVDGSHVGGRRHKMLRAFLLIVGVLMYVMAGVVAWRRVLRPVQEDLTPRYGVVQSDTVVDGCTAATAAVSQPPAEIVDNTSEAVVPAGEAEQRADLVLARHLDYRRGEIPALAGQPELLKATLPDGKQQLVWSRIWIPDFEVAVDANQEDIALAREANSLVIYLNANTNSPLVIYEGVTVTDPLLSGCEETFVDEVAENLNRSVNRLGTTIAMIVTLLVGGGALFVWQRRGHRVKPDEAPATDAGPVDDEMETRPPEEDASLLQ